MTEADETHRSGGGTQGRGLLRGFELTRGFALFLVVTALLFLMAVLNALAPSPVLADLIKYVLGTWGLCVVVLGIAWSTK